MFFRQKRTQGEAGETPRPKPSKRPQSDLDPALEDDTPKKKKKKIKMNTEQEENSSKENQPPKTKKEKKKKSRMAKEEQEGGVVSDQNDELSEAVSSPLSKEGKKKKKKKTKAGKGEATMEISTPITPSNDVPAKKKSKTFLILFILILQLFQNCLCHSK